jgi:hypothetical protein
MAPHGAKEYKIVAPIAAVIEIDFSYSFGYVVV